MSNTGRPPTPLEVKRLRGTLRGDRLPPGGVTEVNRAQVSGAPPEPPERLQAKGRAFWSQVFESAPWAWQGVDDTLIELTCSLLDEREQLRDLVEIRPEDSRQRAQLRLLDKQLVSNLAALGFTPSDRARLGLVQVKTKTWLEQAMEARAARDDLIFHNPES